MNTLFRCIRLFAHRLNVIFPRMMAMTAILAGNIIADAQPTDDKNHRLTLVAESVHQWTGLAFDTTDRLFVNFPRWSQRTPISVGEVVDGKVVAFPDETWQHETYDGHRDNRFTCVQSLQIDRLNRLWVLDTGYDFKTDSATNAKLFVFDIKTRTLIKQYPFVLERFSGAGYLNDFRIDEQRKVVYLSDSGKGGIVVLDLQTGESRRLLKQHPSTLTERDQIIVEGNVRTHPVHADGITLDKRGEYLYYCALMGNNIYRIKTDVLVNRELTDEFLGQAVEEYFQAGGNDGIAMDEFNNLLLTSLERNAIVLITPEKREVTLVRGSAIQWPDSIAFDRRGVAHFTTSQIHIPRTQRGTYKLFRIDRR